MYQTLGLSLGMLAPQAAQKSLPAVGGPQMPPRETNVPHAAFPTLQQQSSNSPRPAPSTPQFATVPQPVGYGYDGALEQPRQKNQLMQALARMG